MRLRTGRVSQGRISRGDPRSPVVLVEFSDFSCPFCARHAEETFDRIDRDFVSNGRVQYVFMHHPREASPGSVLAAAIAECAHRQGGFWPMRDQFFAMHPEFDADQFMSLFRVRRGGD